MKNAFTLGFVGLWLLSGCTPAQPPASQAVASAPALAAPAKAPAAAHATPAAAPVQPDLAAAPPVEEARGATRKHGKLTIHVLDVGQGDSTVIVGPEESGASKVLIIDGGPKGTGTKLKQFFADNKIDHVDYAVLTHFDVDHVGGFVGSKPLFWNSAACDRTALFPKLAIYDHFTSVFKTDAAKDWNTCVSGFSKRIQVGQNAGLSSTMDLGGGYTAKIIAGDGFVLGKTGRVALVKDDQENPRSVVTLISGPGGFDFLVPGDATGQPAGKEKAEVEVAIGEYLSKNSIDLEILRVGHHGSANTSNPTFLKAAKPEVAIISVGDEQGVNYKHPNCGTYKALAAQGVKVVLQTETGRPDCSSPSPAPVVAHGNIRIDVEGANYKISSATASPALALNCSLTGCGGGGATPPSGGHPVATNECCKVCKTSKPCGDSCISATSTCTRDPGCACAAE